jgi:DNA-binding transcriptional LysR family regulator
MDYCKFIRFNQYNAIMDFRLKVFLATRLSFTKAATELFITQPAVSKHTRIRRAIQSQTFNRTSSKIP